MTSFFIYGDPVAQGRPRFARRGNFVSTYDPKKSKEWKEDVKIQAIKCKPMVLQGALTMKLLFCLPRPKSLPKKVKHHIKKPDLDNLCKAVKDALEGVCYERDQQVMELYLKKEYVKDGLPTGVQVVIKELQNENG
jgi:Holliday junction resolvase RusA-like endonuclease